MSGSIGRRMALQNLRSLSEKITIPMAKRFSWMSPLVITWLTLPVGLAAAALMLLAGKDGFGAFMLLAAAALLGIASILDGFDGTADGHGEIAMNRERPREGVVA